MAKRQMSFLRYKHRQVIERSYTYGVVRYLHSDSSIPVKIDDRCTAYFNRRDAKFLLSATKPDHYRHLRFPEVTFAGRSNVGKSSLINAVLRSTRLVKTSRKPGHTSALNFFSLDSRAQDLPSSQITVVDMPGYGFRSRDEWGTFIMQYLSQREVLRQVFLLIEAKVGQLKSTDCSFLELVEKHQVPTQIVLTKTDKLKRMDLERISSNIIVDAMDCAPTAVQPFVLHCSSRTKVGIDTLQEEILRVCGIIPDIISSSQPK